MFELILTQSGFDGTGRYVYITVASCRCRLLVLHHIASAFAAIAKRSGFTLEPTLQKDRWADACEKEPITLGEQRRGHLYMNVTLRAIR